jgi:glycosyltransferase involved in cell wall biosynthesis
MKVAIVNQPFGVIYLPNPGSGISIWTHQVARHLARCADVIVYLRRGKAQTRTEVSEAVKYRRLSVRLDLLVLKALRLWWKYRHPERPIFDARGYYRRYALRAAKDLAAQQCDVVHVHNFSQFVPLIRARDPNVKIALHMHGEWLTQLDRATIEKRLEMADLIFGCSGYIVGKIQRRFPEFAGRCRVVFNGVDVNRFAKNGGNPRTTDRGDKRLLFVGRISPEKGLHVLIEAFRMVLQRYPRTRLEVIGPEWILPTEFLVEVSDDPKILELRSFYDGKSYLQELKRVLSKQVADRVSFLGKVRRGPLVEHYRGADVLVNASLSESFGMSLIEGMACQVPVVATRVGGMTEIVEQGHCGLLVEPNDPDALADAILRLLGNDELRRSFGEAGRAAVLRLFSWERITENVLNCYRDVLQSNA